MPQPVSLKRSLMTQSPSAGTANMFFRVAHLPRSQFVNGFDCVMGRESGNTHELIKETTYSFSSCLTLSVPLAISTKLLNHSIYVLYFLMGFAGRSVRWGGECLKMKVSVKTANCGDRDQCTNNGVCHATSNTVIQYDALYINKDHQVLYIYKEACSFVYLTRNIVVFLLLFLRRE